jgi:AraC-like DNA-binding protein
VAVPYFIRSGSLTGFAEVAREAGLDPSRLLREFRVQRNFLREPDLMMPIEPACRMLQAAAERSGVEAFGLLMAEARKVSSLGPLGMFVREQPTLREAVDAMARYARLLNESLAISIEQSSEVAVIREELLVGDAVSVRQPTELAVGLLFKLMRGFLGPDWKPRRVCFRHEAPQDRTVHQRVFGREVHFGADFSGIVCSPRDLTVVNPQADPTIARYAKQLLDSHAPAGSEDFTSQVRQLVLMQLSSGNCSVDRVAQMLRLDRRTIHRRLLAEDRTFTDIVESVRVELVSRYLAERRTTLTQMASLLGFAAPSGFSRWYKQRFGTTASDARARRGRGES